MLLISSKSIIKTFFLIAERDVARLIVVVVFPTPPFWLVIDIIIEGVSLVTNYRSQFASEIRRNGMDSLIKALAKKNESNEK